MLDMQSRTVGEIALGIVVLLLWFTAQSSHFALEKAREAHERDVLELHELVQQIQDRAKKVSDTHCNLTALALKVAHASSARASPLLQAPPVSRTATTSACPVCKACRRRRQLARSSPVLPLQASPSRPRVPIQ